MIILTIGYAIIALNKLFLLIYYTESFIDFMRIDPDFHLSSTVNLVPIISMNGADARNFLLNIVLFVPWGFFLYYFTKNLKKTIVMIVMTTIGIETIQFAGNVFYQFMWRVVDVNDVLANIIGGIVGLLVMTIIIKLVD